MTVCVLGVVYSVTRKIAQYLGEVLEDTTPTRDKLIENLKINDGSGTFASSHDLRLCVSLVVCLCVCVCVCVRASVCVREREAKQFTPCLIPLIRQMSFLWYLNRSQHCISSVRRLRES